MKKLLLILGLTLLGIAGSKAEEKFTVIGQKCLGTGMSPAGKYVVGVDVSTYAGSTYIKSYLYNTVTGQQDWLTEYDETDLAKSGHFTDVTDYGVIAGSFRDTDYQISVEGEALFPINVAAIWKDGLKTSLGIGNFKLSEFTQLGDGSFATAISNDGATVVGYIGLRGSFSFPCIWKFDQSKGEWAYSALSIPEDAVGGKATDISADGSIIVGTIWYKTSEVAAYWSNGECHLIKGAGDDVQYNDGTNRNRADAVSPNGKYVAFVFNFRIPAIYDIENQSYVKPEIYDNKQPEKLAVSDNGDVISTYKYGHLLAGEVYHRPFWYSHSDNKTLGFDYFMNLFAPNVKPPFTMLYEEKTRAVPCAISADGSVIMGNNNTMMALGEIPESWVLCMDKQETQILEAFGQIQVRSLNLKEVTLNWEKEKHTYEGLASQSYTVYCDGIKIADVTDEDKENFSFIQNDVTPGFPKYSVASVFKNNRTGTLIESPKSEPVAVAVPDTYSMPLYDDFDTSTTDASYWTKELQTGDILDGVWSCMPYSGIVDRALYTSTPNDPHPYSSTCASRPMDATNKENIWLSFGMSTILMSGKEWPLEKDSLSIDVTTDKGVNWTEIKTYSLKQLPRNWNFLGVDLSPWVAGKLFQVRLRKHGQGAAPCIYNIDLLRVGARAENEAMEGLTGTADGKNVNLIWKNSNKVYSLNYMTGASSRAIGDEDKPFIAVNSFDGKELKAYEGKYLTSVKTYVNHDSNIPDSKETHASVVVFQNGELIREQEIGQIEYNENNVVILKEPVRIDATKELKIGMKIFDYDERQMPVTYQITTDFIAGKSDLYSQDGGKTWEKLSDFYAAIKGQESNGYCCWNISAGITNEQIFAPDQANDNEAYAYSIYRNGEQLNHKLIYRDNSRYTDSESLDNATYEVIAYYLDGSVSEISVPFAWESGSSINGEEADSRIIVSPNPATDYLKINGDFDRATLFSLKGEAIMVTQDNRINLTGLAEGIYLLKVENRDGVGNYKVIIKK